MSRHNISWSELQSELLTLISDRLGTQSDMCHFRSVCKQWRDANSFSTCRPQNLLSSILGYEILIDDDCNLSTDLLNIFPILIVPSSIFVVQSIISSKTSPWLCTVEEFNAGKLYLRQPLSQLAIKCLTPGVPNKFNLSYFKVKEVGRFYTPRSCRAPDDMFKWNHLVGEKLLFDSKVVLMADPNCKSISPGIVDYNAILLTGKGVLLLIVIKHRRYEKIRGTKIKIFDDVINYKGSIYVIDRKGRLYSMNYNSNLLCDVVEQPVGEGLGSDRKKYLVVSDTGELYLIHRSPPYMNALFKLYKLNAEGNRWEEVAGIGADRILFVTSDGCFFVETKDFPGFKGNCVVFRKGQFLGYNNGGTPDLDIFSSKYDGCRLHFDIGLFYFEDGNCGPVKLYPGYSKFFWPPPDWLSSDTEVLGKGIVTSAEIEIVRYFCNRVHSDQDLDTEMTVADLMIAIKDQHQDKKGKCHDVIPNDVRPPVIIDFNSFPDIEPKDSETMVSLGTFQGVDVCSNLIPILEKILEKYGNIVQDHVVKSDSHLKWALESLAKMVIILQTRSIESLNESQANFLSATLKDLQYLHIRLDWLAPFVDKVSAQKELCRS